MSLSDYYCIPFYCQALTMICQYYSNEITLAIKLHIKIILQPNVKFILLLGSQMVVTDISDQEGKN